MIPEQIRLNRRFAKTLRDAKIQFLEFELDPENREVKSLLLASPDQVGEAEKVIQSFDWAATDLDTPTLKSIDEVKDQITGLSTTSSVKVQQVIDNAIRADFLLRNPDFLKKLADQGVQIEVTKAAQVNP